MSQDSGLKVVTGAKKKKLPLLLSGAELSKDQTPDLYHHPAENTPTYTSPPKKIHLTFPTHSA